MTMKNYNVGLAANGANKFDVQGRSVFIRSLPEGIGFVTIIFRHVQLEGKDGQFSTLVMGADERVRFPEEFDRLEIDSSIAGRMEIIVGDGDFQRTVPSINGGTRVGLFVNLQAMALNAEFALSNAGPFTASVRRIIWQARTANPGTLWLTESGGGAALAGFELLPGGSLITEVNDDTDIGSDNVWFSDANGNVLTWLTEFYPDIL